ncbi:hypothetical protein [Kosakonia sacchari]|uniref:hypothetical protein n=1 Tax=Kosakonia sacchari TaxID=1158459 RepID=UPI0032D9133D
MESPLLNTPHVAKHPEAVIAYIWSLVHEVRLIALYPVICISLTEMPVARVKLPYEVCGAQALVSLWVALNGSNKGGVYLVLARHDLNLLNNTVYINSSNF